MSYLTITVTYKHLPHIFTNLWDWKRTHCVGPQLCCNEKFIQLNFLFQYGIQPHEHSFRNEVREKLLCKSLESTICIATSTNITSNCPVSERQRVHWYLRWFTVLHLLLLLFKWLPATIDAVARSVLSKLFVHGHLQSEDSALFVHSWPA